MLYFVYDKDTFSFSELTKRFIRFAPLFFYVSILYQIVVEVLTWTHVKHFYYLQKSKAALIVLYFTKDA